MSAIQKLITDHIDIWTAADTEKKSGRGRSSGNSASVYGVKKLRELILELAMRGKLVPQDPKDEPASELLKKIQAEISRKGSAKTNKDHPVINFSESLYEIPSSWQWVRFGNIAQHNSGKTLDKGRNSGTSRDYITTSNLYWGRFDLASLRQMPIRNEEVEKCTARKGDLLICEGGEAGRAAVWPFDKEVCFQNHIHRARLVANNDPYFAFRFFQKLSFTGEIDQYRKGVAISNISSKALSSIPFPLPPLAEQHRIVAKVDELMALCDQLEAQHNNIAEAHEKLVTQFLATLTQSQNAGEFSENWQRIAAHFDTLFTTEESIDALKQTLLQLAVMGKLVPQDPKDEPTSELLKKIQAEKANLIAEGKIKQEKLQSLINDEEKPFSIPQEWQWARMGDIASVVDPNPSHRMPKYVSEGIPFVSTENFAINDTIDFSIGKMVSPETLKEQVHKFDIRKGAFAISRIGTIGKTRMLPLQRNYCLSHALCVISPYLDLINSKYLRLAVTAESILSHAHAGVKSIGVPDLGVGTIRSMPIPIPTMQEQNRIVAKVDGLMALCEQLTARINFANQLKRKLADTMVEKALTSKSQVVGAELPSRDEARALLGAEIIHQLHVEKTFGQVKLQKIAHLCEYIAEIDAVNGEYQRYAAGPHDPELIVDIEAAIKKNAWYEEYPRDKVGHAYRPLAHAGKHADQLSTYWQEKLPVIRKIIDVMRKWETERCEIVSTLYAAWNDLIILGKPVTNDAILSEVLERWHERKTKISKQDWLKGLEWMRKEGFVPKGFGRATRVAGLFD